MADFYIKQNDTEPSFKAQLLDENDNIIDLTGVSTVEFHMDDMSGNVVVDSNAVIEDKNNGIVKYSWSASDTTNSGMFNAEFQVNYSSGGIETFPNSEHLTVIIMEEVG